jgi:glycine/D-amino acid oxidase-like deaminating enzyme
MQVLICGGRVIGASIAYFLARRGVKATVIERCRLACAASGKSGGFLAADWCDGTPLADGNLRTLPGLRIRPRGSYRIPGW